VINLNEATQEAALRKAVTFRWKYIVTPLAILLISIILVAYFYPLMPDEIAYHFTDGAPDRWTSRTSITSWLLIPQFLLTLLAAGIVWAAIRLSARLQQTESGAVSIMLAIMGNMIALPQIILGFAMLDIFSYNAYRIHLIPLWVFAVLVMAVGGIILGIFFLQAIRRVQTTAQVSRSNNSGGSTKQG